MGGMIRVISSALHPATEIDWRTARYTNNNFAGYLIPVNADLRDVQVLFVPKTDYEVIYHVVGVLIRESPVRIGKLL